MDSDEFDLELANTVLAAPDKPAYRQLGT
ncbi:hypothetical protein BQ8482_110588 [Mesorhizobium delmotii]|uniref:Uncharacterized protein n=1 Tax=Mesorhizobium delmotii TaxID=1631247 RepID=A0A2P9ABY0_9HYPH|nr:hypothetical protein BQ8482_110588 [Mesorhizobium delmotii]